MRSHCQAVGLHFGDHGICGHDANGGVSAGQQRLGWVAAQQGAACIAQAKPIVGAGAGNHLRGVRVNHVPQGVAGNQRAHGYAIHGH